MNVPKVARFVLPLRWSYPEWWSCLLCCRQMQAHKTWVCRTIRPGLCHAFWDGPMSPQVWRGSLLGNFQPVKKGELGEKAGASFSVLRPLLLTRVKTQVGWTVRTCLSTTYHDLDLAGCQCWASYQVLDAQIPEFAFIEHPGTLIFTE